MGTDCGEVVEKPVVGNRSSGPGEGGEVNIRTRKKFRKPFEDFRLGAKKRDAENDDLKDRVVARWRLRDHTRANTNQRYGMSEEDSASVTTEISVTSGAFHAGVVLSVASGFVMREEYRFTPMQHAHFRISR